jgi:hypothetical protein
LIEIYTWMEDKASTYEHINEVMWSTHTVSENKNCESRLINQVFKKP